MSAVAPNPKTVAAHEALLAHERALWSQGLSTVAGLDEAGAGPWAGPVAAGCVVLDPAKTNALLGVDDSKKLNEEKRETFAVLIEANALGFAVASATVEEIDRHNIRIAGSLTMRRAYETVAEKLGAADHLLIDARSLPELRRPQTNLIKGDSSSRSIAAASILAKVCPDRVMIDADREYQATVSEVTKGTARRSTRRPSRGWGQRRCTGGRSPRCAPSSSHRPR